MPAQKYTAIYEDLKKKIEEGLYAPQSVLPSENILTTRYGVSRNTVRRAIAQLADESYVQSIHGEGDQRIKFCMTKGQCLRHCPFFLFVHEES
jgi:GntR family trehalose operon transcriptional repressor